MGVKAKLRREAQSAILYQSNRSNAISGSDVEQVQ